MRDGISFGDIQSLGLTKYNDQVQIEFWGYDLDSNLTDVIFLTKQQCETIYELSKLLKDDS